MSTHINGYLINVKDFSGMDKFLSTLRSDICKAQKRHYLKFVAQRMCEQLDICSIDPKASKPRLFDIRKDFDDRQVEVFKTSRRDPEVDLSFSVCWFYYRKKFYTTLHTEQPEFTKIFEDNKLVKDFKYYNHSDPPDGISYSQFKKREKVWDKIIPSGIPNKHGYVLELDPQRFDLLTFGKNDEYHKHQPSLNQRAKDLMIHHLSLKSPVRSLEEYLKANREVLNPNSDMKVKLAELATKIKKRYTKEDFLI